jgi:FkbM family methyltransferase
MHTKLENLANEWLPPKIARRLTRRSREKRELSHFIEFYQQFMTAGDLCFDVGANLGNRTHAFLRLGCKVVAVEPQSKCIKRLQKKFSDNERFIIEPIALGSSPGRAELNVSSNHVLSTLSENFIERTVKSGRFYPDHWTHREIVKISTLDQLIGKHGVPDFIKIDVEGFESEVLSGLSRQVSTISFEWTPECNDNAKSCVQHLSQLGDYEYNLSWGESMKFAKKSWRTPESILELITEFESESILFGDIYARLKK